jgi:carbon storage regulator CsrA
MLVLSRKPNEKLRIGGTVTVTVLKVRGNVVKLGIEAPDNVRILRVELQSCVGCEIDPIDPKAAVQTAVAIAG